MAKRTSSHREMRKVNKFRVDNYDSYSSNSSSIYYLYYSSSYDNEWNMDKLKTMKINKLYHIVTTNSKEYNQVNDVVNKKLKFDSNYSIYGSPIKYPQPIVTAILIGGNKYRNTLVSCLTLLWYIIDSSDMINRKHII